MAGVSNRATALSQHQIGETNRAGQCQGCFKNFAARGNYRAIVCVTFAREGR